MDDPPITQGVVLDTLEERCADIDVLGGGEHLAIAHCKHAPWRLGLKLGHRDCQLCPWDAAVSHVGRYVLDPVFRRNPCQQHAGCKVGRLQGGSPLGYQMAAQASNHQRSRLIPVLPLP